MANELEWFFQQKDIEHKLRGLLGRPRKDIQDYLKKELSLEQTNHACYDFEFRRDNYKLYIELKIQADLQWLDPIKLYCTCKKCESKTVYLFVCTKIDKDIKKEHKVDKILMITQSALREVLENWSEAPWGTKLVDFISNLCDRFRTEKDLSKVQIKCPLYIKRDLIGHLERKRPDGRSKEWIVLPSGFVA